MKEVKENPCKPDCEKRSATCHAKCKKYLEFHESRKSEYKKNIANADALDYTLREIKKNKKVIRKV